MPDNQSPDNSTVHHDNQYNEEINNNVKEADGEPAEYDKSCSPAHEPPTPQDSEPVNSSQGMHFLQPDSVRNAFPGFSLSFHSWPHAYHLPGDGALSVKMSDEDSSPPPAPTESSAEPPATPQRATPDTLTEEQRQLVKQEEEQRAAQTKQISKRINGKQSPPILCDACTVTFPPCLENLAVCS